MAQDAWPESRDQLLQDIENFALHGGLPKNEAAVGAERVSTSVAKSVAATGDTNAVQAAPPVAATPRASATPATGTQPSAATSSGLLAQLKQQAEAKLAGEEQQSSQLTRWQTEVSAALQRAFLYFDEFAKQLNVLKPAYEKAYPFFGVVDFDGLHWEEGRADYRLQPVSTEERIFEQATLRFRLLADKRFRVSRENPAQEKLRKALFDHGIVFTVDEEKNDRARVEKATFTFPCEIKAGLSIAGDAAQGELVLKLRNIERFGMMELRTTPAALNATALDELATLILGKALRLERFRRVS